ncbi:MAG TPA: hypothetical protein VLT59_06570 [Steroidobacteraceae bacterium]|nr:hypothetical protein [Steroidobacteraceae bacterium]
MSELIRVLASWALVHEMADIGWKAAIERGESGGGEGLRATPDAFVDALAALVAGEKERLKSEIAAGEEAPGRHQDVGAQLDRVLHEIGELRGRIESMQALLDARLEPRDGR